MIHTPYLLGRQRKVRLSSAMVPVIRTAVLFAGPVAKIVAVTQRSENRRAAFILSSWAATASRIPRGAVGSWWQSRIIRDASHGR